jgi:hypothetical protein
MGVLLNLRADHTASLLFTEYVSRGEMPGLTGRRRTRTSSPALRSPKRLRAEAADPQLEDALEDGSLLYSSLKDAGLVVRKADVPNLLFCDQVAAPSDEC